MSEIYCVKCKWKTSTKNEKIITTKNNHLAVTGNCNLCNTKKNMFIKNKYNI